MRKLSKFQYTCTICCHFLALLEGCKAEFLPEEDTVGNLHIPWQTGLHCLILAGSGEFTRIVKVNSDASERILSSWGVELPLKIIWHCRK